MTHWMKRAAMTSALVLMAACTKPESVDETKRGYRLPTSETHLTFTLPELRPSGSFKGRPAVTFRIPKEYVRFQGVLSRNGQIYQVPLQIELPGPTPWQERPWLKGKKGTPEWDEFMKGWIGKFIVTLGAGSGQGGRGYFLNSISPENVQRRTDMIADGEVYGLVRYSPQRCYTPEHLKNPQHKAFLDAKPVDDPMPEANCRVDRRSAQYFSPLNVTDVEKVVSVDCATTRCWVSFNVVDAVGASLSFSHDKLERWPELVDPTRELLRSFIVGSAPNSRVKAAP